MMCLQTSALFRLLDISKSRHPASWIGFVLGLGVALSLFAFFMVRGWQRSDAQKSAAELVHNQVEKLQLSILRSMEVLHSIAALHAVEGTIQRETFQEFVQATLQRQPELQALSWNPIVPGSSRAAFEAEAVASGLDGFVIRQHNAAGQLVPAAASAQYVPVSWIEPLSRNILALGFDLNSDSRRREFLLQARDTGRAVATSPIRLAQADAPGFLVLQPVYRSGGVPESVEARQSQLTGYAVAVFSVPTLVEGILGELHRKGIQARLIDGSETGETIHGETLKEPASVMWLEVASRRWTLMYAPTVGFAGARSSWQSWLILVAGLAFTLLTTAYLYGGWRSSQEVAQANQALREEVVIRERAEKAAATANEAKSDFLASMSHEIRTPLNAILGYAQLMQREAQLSPEQRDTIGGITVSGQHLLGLINEILDLSKIEAGRAELNPTDFDLAMLARGLEMTFQPLCAQKRIQFRAMVPSTGLLRVRGDENKLRQVLINLAGNAVKFTAVGEVYINASPCGEQRWLFEVVDTGLGIPSEEQASIFKPFHQGRGAQHQGGTGLGLAIAQRQVELLGGELRFTSERGAGSRFYFSIPLGVAESQASVSAPTVRRLAPGQRVRALVVDDRPENREVLGRMLRAIGCEVTFAANGEEALKASGSHTDIIYLDWLMPGLSGGELVQKLMSAAGSPPIVVAHSASVLPRHAEEARVAGCVDFIAKPFRCERIYESLRNGLGVRLEYEAATESESLPKLEGVRVVLPEEMGARLAVAAELHSTTTLKNALQELRQVGPEARILAEHIRHLMRSYDMDAIQRLLASTVTTATNSAVLPPYAGHPS
jgi:signal transduction histidine kinase/CheY-like chemotaxis protein